MSRMKLEYTADDIREVEQDAYERGRRDALQEMSSEDCINRAEAIDALDWIPKHKQIGLVEWSIRESDVRGMLRRLPRVVMSRTEGDITKQFLSLEDAVLIAQRELEVDPEIARVEFEQKCYVSDNQYTIGYDDGLADAIKAIRGLESEETE